MRNHTVTLRPDVMITMKIIFMAKCTVFLNGRIPITIRFGQLTDVMREILRDNHDMIAHSS